MAPKAVRRAEREDEARRVRARLNEHEGQIDDLQGVARHHDLRLQYLEAPYKWVTRGFTSTQAFFAEEGRELPRCKGLVFDRVFAGTSRPYTGDRGRSSGGI